MNKIRVILAFLKGYIAAHRTTSLTKQQRAKQQDKQFQHLKKTVLSQSRYYQPYLEHDLSGFPIIDKNTHMAHFNQINTAALDRETCLAIAIQSEQTRDFSPSYHGFSVGLSSGTSGARGLFVASPTERAEWAGYIIGKLLPHSMKRQRIALFLRANNSLYQTINNPLITLHYFDLSKPLSHHLEPLNRLAPSIIVAPAQVLKDLAKAKSHIPEVLPNKLISVAEVLDQADQTFIESQFKLTVDQIYQCTEGFLASTCVHGNLHLNEDSLIVEKHWLDKKTARFTPIITDLTRRTQPIIRYRLNDILIEDRQPCPCGSSLTHLARIEGRCDDIFKMHARSGELITIYPDLISHALLTSHPDIKDYKVIQQHSNQIALYLDPFDNTIFSAIEQQLNRLWAGFNIAQPHYKRFAYQMTNPLFKKRRIVSTYHG